METYISRYGMVARSLPFTTGKVFFVKNATDADFAEFQNNFPPDQDGVQRVYSTFAAAAAATAANRYDIVVVPDATFVTAINQALLASKARIVQIGDDISAGSSFTLKKTVTSSALTTLAVDLTAVSAGGDLYIENIVVKTDGTGLAGATNFRILSNNVKGLAAILEETVANLGANKTVDLFTASVVKQRTVLESGAKLQVLGTVSAGTGAGTVDIYITFKRATANATIS